ncbi:MAG: peptidylprolyl isomerase, partial [Pontibacterium sp.]
MNIKSARNFAVSLLLSCSVATATAEIPVDHVIAIVNDGIVLNSDLEDRIEIVASNAKTAGTTLPPMSILREQIIDRLILEEVQIQEAERAGVRISDRQLTAALNNIAQRNNQSLQEFRRNLLAEGQDFDVLREEIRRSIMINQIQRSRVNSRITVTEQDIENYLNSDEAKVNNTTELFLSNILIAINAGATPQQISALEQRAKEIRQRLAQGEDFAQLALTFSNAPNALKGGSLGWRKEQELPTDLSAALKNKPEGFISQPIRLSSGYHIIRIDEKRGGIEA